MDPAELLARLDPEQREAALAPPGPVGILAGAGTGKTRTITHRIAYGVATGAMAPGQVLAVTFTARAAAEMRERLRALGVPAVQARTFHAAALRQLTYFAPRILGGPMPRLVESKARLVADAAGRRRLGANRAELRDLISELEWATARLIDPAAYPAAAAAAGRTPPRDPQVVSQLARDYAEVKSRAGVVDFDDLLLLVAAAMEEQPDIAAEIRSQYRHFVVDEYQDATPLQQRLLQAWLGERDTLTVVGDPAQTIYSFAGAEPNLLLGFGQRFPGAAVVRLLRDYRSTPQVVELANRVLTALGPAAGPGPRVALTAMRPPGPPAALIEASDEGDEAAQVAAAIAGLIEGGTPPSEIAVLYRINSASEAYEQALGAAGIAYLVRGGERFFDRPEVREAMVLLRGAARSAETPADLPAAVTEVLGARGWKPGEPPAGGAARERWENLAALLHLAQAPTAPPTLAGFVALLAERAEAAHAPTVQGVTLASLHAAKGLEWDAVFLVGLTEGLLPIVHAATPAQVTEERRLFYVGLTRARVHLTLSYALARAAGGRGTRTPSRFLDGLLPGAQRPARAGSGRPAASPGRGSRKSRSAARCRGCGAVLASAPERAVGRCAGCPGGADPQVFERLRGWRAGVARELGQPAYCVFTDATLSAIAELAPADTTALAAIPGVGAVKLAKWGADVLGLCARPR